MLRYIFFFVATISILACQNPKNQAAESDRQNASIAADTLNSLTFKEVNGIRFYEVKRRFNNGLSFNEDGFQQEPTWVIEYKYPDTMLAFSPELNDMEHFYLQYDHGKVYNFAREFFRAIKITKDSLILQRLQVEGRKVKKGLQSDVFCIYYTKSYIENKLKTTVETLRKPTKRDTVFISNLIAKSNKNPVKLPFAARQPVQFIPKSNNVNTQKLVTEDKLTGKGRAFDYMYPEYRLEIKKSYKEFAYRFGAVVDQNGKITVTRVEGVMPEDYATRKKLIQGICDVYLSHLYTIVPGKTLGMPHSSEITLNIVGKLAK